MNDLHTSLTNAYNTQHAVMLPGSGTYAMEAAARAFGHEGDVVVVRNGYFSYRWSQLFECMGKSDDQVHVMKARPANGWSDDEDRGVQPPPIEEVVAKIRDVKPSMVCAPHVETSAGIILNKEYCKAIGDACKEVGATFCLDGVASGTAWVDMDYANIGAYITAPQKGWSGPAAVGVCMMSMRSLRRRRSAAGTSFTVVSQMEDVMGASATAATCTTRRCRRCTSSRRLHEWKLGPPKEAEKATPTGNGRAQGLKDKGAASRRRQINWARSSQSPRLRAQVAAEGWRRRGRGGLCQ